VTEHGSRKEEQVLDEAVRVAVESVHPGDKVGGAANEPSALSRRLEVRPLDNVIDPLKQARIGQCNNRAKYSLVQYLNSSLLSLQFSAKAWQVSNSSHFAFIAELYQALSSTSFCVEVDQSHCPAVSPAK
jgi:hypothetical protein